MSAQRRRRPHPARLERRIVGAASALFGVGMVTSLSVAAQAAQGQTAVRTEVASQAPVTAPRLDLTRSSTTSLPAFTLDGSASTVSSSTTTTEAPKISAVPTTTRRYSPAPTQTQGEDPPPPTEGAPTTVTTTTSTTSTTIPPTTTIEETTTTTIDETTTTTLGS